MPYLTASTGIIYDEDIIRKIQITKPYNLTALIIIKILLRGYFSLSNYARSVLTLRAVNIFLRKQVHFLEAMNQTGFFFLHPFTTFVSKRRFLLSLQILRPNKNRPRTRGQKTWFFVGTLPIVKIEWASVFWFVGGLIGGHWLFGLFWEQRVRHFVHNHFIYHKDAFSTWGSMTHAFEGF